MYISIFFNEKLELSFHFGAAIGDFRNVSSDLLGLQAVKLTLYTQMPFQTSGWLKIRGGVLVFRVWDRCVLL